MKTAVSIPDSVFRAADAAARRLRISRSQLYAQALEHYLASESDEDVTARLDAIYSTEDSRLDPVVATTQRETLLGSE